MVLNDENGMLDVQDMSSFICASYLTDPTQRMLVVLPQKKDVEELYSAIIESLPALNVVKYIGTCPPPPASMVHRPRIVRRMTPVARSMLFTHVPDRRLYTVTTACRPTRRLDGDPHARALCHKRRYGALSYRARPLVTTRTHARTSSMLQAKASTSHIALHRGLVFSNGAKKNRIKRSTLFCFLFLGFLGPKDGVKCEILMTTLQILTDLEPARAIHGMAPWNMVIIDEGHAKDKMKLDQKMYDKLRQANLFESVGDSVRLVIAREPMSAACSLRSFSVGQTAGLDGSCVKPNMLTWKYDHSSKGVPKRTVKPSRVYANIMERIKQGVRMPTQTIRKEATQTTPLSPPPATVPKLPAASLAAQGADRPAKTAADMEAEEVGSKDGSSRASSPQEGYAAMNTGKSSPAVRAETPSEEAGMVNLFAVLAEKNLLPGYTGTDQHASASTENVEIRASDETIGLNFDDLVQRLVMAEPAADAVNTTTA